MCNGNSVFPGGFWQKKMEGGDEEMRRAGEERLRRACLVATAAGRPGG